MKSGVSRAEANRAIRKKALREQLQAQGHAQHAFDLINKLKNLDIHMESVEFQRVSKALDGHFKMLSKYLPDDKDPTDVNLGGQEDNPIDTKWTVEIVRSNASKDS